MSTRACGARNGSWPARLISILTSLVLQLSVACWMPSRRAGALPVVVTPDVSLPTCRLPHASWLRSTVTSKNPEETGIGGGGGMLKVAAQSQEARPPPEQAMAERRRRVR